MVVFDASSRATKVLWFLLLAGGLLLGVGACLQSEQAELVANDEAMSEDEGASSTGLEGELGPIFAIPASALLDLAPGADGSDKTTLDVSYAADLTALDPHTVSSPSAITLVENLFAGLTRYNHATDTVEPELATSWEVSADGRTWTFHLRDDIFWHYSPFQDTGISFGQRAAEIYRPVVAADMVASVQRLCSELESPDVFIFFIIEGCEAIYSLREPTEEELAAIGVRALDESTLEFRLTKPAAYFLTMTTLWLFRPLPAEIIEEARDSDESWDTLENLVSSGPFVLGPDSVGDALTVLERNPSWPLPFSGNLERVNVWWLPADAAYETWLNKDLDLTRLPAERQEEVENNAILRARRQLVTNQQAFYLAFNFDSPVFGEEAVRRAFSAAIDREALVEEVYEMQGEPARHLSPPGVIGAPPAEIVGVGYNPDLARIEMANSSFLDCRFLPEVRYLVGDSDLALFHAETLRSMWVRELSCVEEQIVIEQVQFGELLLATRADAGASRPDIWNFGWASFYPDAHNWLYDVLHCQESENRQKRPCSQVDDLLRDAASTLDVSERWDLYRQAERVFFGEGGSGPVAPLLVQGEFRMVQSWVNFSPAHFGGEQFDTYNLAADIKALERQQ